MFFYFFFFKKCRFTSTAVDKKIRENFVLMRNSFLNANENICCDPSLGPFK